MKVHRIIGNKSCFALCVVAHLQALAKERSSRQNLAGQLEVSQAELQASRSASQKAQATRAAEAQQTVARWVQVMGQGQGADDNDNSY